MALIGAGVGRPMQAPWRGRGVSLGIDRSVEAGLDIHVVLDNLSAHKSQPVRDWLAHAKRARWHLHFTPTSALWLNLIEGWFSVLTRKPLTNNSFTSIDDLQSTIDLWTSAWNDDPQHLVWTESAEDIIARSHEDAPPSLKPRHTTSTQSGVAGSLVTLLRSGNVNHEMPHSQRCTSISL